MKEIYKILFILLLAVQSLFAQANRAEIVVRFQPNINITNWQNKYVTKEENPIQFKEIITQRFNLALFDFDNTQYSFTEIKKLLSKEQDILWITPNHVNVESRNIPNDDFYSNQWNMKDIGIENFWTRTTGGTTYYGDTIVLAIMENGTALNHPDLKQNIWHNYLETPADGIDNDGNGYVDDFTGWNATDQNGQHTFNSHGSQVAGVIGASGNNDIGVAGINWQVKLMPITFSKDEVATYFVAFDYLIEQRKLYNESNGKKGAFIVAVNESFGQNKAKPADTPGWTQWCEYIDALGEVGILTIGATSNARLNNVDEVGDMPTNCPQDYLIAVTSIDLFGNRLGAYGFTSIDLAAPGKDIPTTLGPTDTYSSVSGTSYATPHITGAIGLIYSYPCEYWANYIKAFPAESALLAKKWLLESTTPKLSTNGVTVSGGSLNLDKVINRIDYFCGGNQLNPIDLTINPTLTNGEINFKFTTPTFGQHHLQVFNMLGQLVYTKTIDSTLNEAQVGSIQLDFLKPGIYTLTLSKKDNFVTKRIVKY